MSKITKVTRTETSFILRLNNGEVVTYPDDPTMNLKGMFDLWIKNGTLLEITCDHHDLVTNIKVLPTSKRCCIL
jgi:hypothetical protein